MLYKATFNNIPAISWRSVLLVEETRVPGENHRQTLSPNVVLDFANETRCCMLRRAKNTLTRSFVSHRVNRK